MNGLDIKRLSLSASDAYNELTSKAKSVTHQDEVLIRQFQEESIEWFSMDTVNAYEAWIKELLEKSKEELITDKNEMVKFLSQRKGAHDEDEFNKDY